MQQTADMARQAIEDMRRMFAVLRAGEVAGPAELAPQPAGQDLLQLIATFQTAGLPVTGHLDGPVPTDPVLALTVYRLLQEALTNALRYATGATRVTANVTSAADSVTVCVTDNGRTDGRPSQGSGQGLVGMSQRVAAFDGTLEAGPTPEGGWRVHAVLKSPHPQPEGTTP
jgi:signal transduction histidine kinase